MYKYSQYNIVIENFKERDSEYVILFNSYSGGILKLEKSIFNNIYRGEISQLKQNDLGVLIKGGYILDENINEFNRVKNRYALECINQKPEKVNYVIAPTLNCNLHCIYCFQKDKRNDIDHIMSDETLKQVINFIVRENNNNDNLKKIVINWFGGEPLLCFDIIAKANKNIIEAFKQKNILIETNITTNGVLLDKSKLKELTDRCNLSHIQITLDGEMNSYCAKKMTTPEVFNKVINNLIDASKVAKVTIRLNADKKNYNEFTNLINFIYASGVNDKNIKNSLCTIT